MMCKSQKKKKHLSNFMYLKRAKRKSMVNEMDLRLMAAGFSDNVGRDCSYDWCSGARFS